MKQQTVVERAFELARSGIYPDVAAMEKRLKSENYDYVPHLSSTALRRQLRGIIKEARGSAPQPLPETPDTATGEHG